MFGFEQVPNFTARSDANERPAVPETKRLGFGFVHKAPSPDSD